MVVVNSGAETERIFKSANCEEILIPEHYTGIPREVAVVVREEINHVKQSIGKMQKEIFI